MHDVAVALDEELVGDLDGADLGDAADIVAAEVEQHQMLGALLRIGEQLAPPAPCPRAASRRAAACRRSAGSSPCRRARRTRISGLEPATAKPPKSRKIQERRRVDAAQRAVERERRQRERRLEALRQHHLEDVAGRDVFLRASHHRAVFVRRGVGLSAARRAARRRRRPRPCRAAGRAHRRSPASRSLRARERGLRRDARLRPHRRHDGDRVLHRVEHDHDASGGSGPRRECRSDRDWAAGSSSISRTMS